MVNFIYPEDKPIFTNEQKEEIKNAVCEIINIKSKVECKFNKSYLDKNIVIKSIKDFVNLNFTSISSYFTDESIDYKRDSISVTLTISANETLKNYIDENYICEKIKNHLLKNFCGDFVVVAEKNNEVLDEEMLEERAVFMQNNIQQEKKAPRYKVGEPMEVFGGEIMPMPEYIKNLKAEKFACILAGNVSELVEKEYVPRRNKAKGIDDKMKFYTFKLDDGSAKINCVHFCTKTSQKHFCLIEEGSHIICKGDYVKKMTGDMQYIIKAISLCKKLEDSEAKLEEEVAINNQQNYQFVKPVPYTRTIQDNLFAPKKDYPDYIKNNTYVVFDVETTGLSPETNDITEIGAVKIVNGEITEKFQSLCKPFEKIPQEITRLTGITDEMVQNMPLSTDIISDFLMFAKDATLVGYNVNFDYSFIQNVAKRISKQVNNPKRDCLNDARAKVYLPNYKLKNLVSHLGITLDNAHRALYDATATAEAFLALSLM